MKRFVALCLIFVLCTSTLTACALDIVGTPYVKTTNEGTITEALEVCKQRKVTAHEMAECARALGYPEDSVVIQTASAEWWSADEAEKKYEEDLIKLDAFWNQRKETYPVATEVWLYFKDLGYNDAVIAGIIGNMMTETGGNTLKLKYNITSPGGSFYGLCQWNHAYPAVWGCGLEEQCDFLRDTIEYEFNTYGYMYYKGFNYSKFLELNDSEDAALAFSKVYERCGSSTNRARQKNALVAYEYFTDFE